MRGVREQRQRVRDDAADDLDRGEAEHEGERDGERAARTPARLELEVAVPGRRRVRVAHDLDGTVRYRPLTPRIPAATLESCSPPPDAA